MRHLMIILVVLILVGCSNQRSSVHEIKHEGYYFRSWLQEANSNIFWCEVEAYDANIKSSPSEAYCSEIVRDKLNKGVDLAAFYNTYDGLLYLDISNKLSYFGLTHENIYDELARIQPTIDVYNAEEVLLSIAKSVTNKVKNSGKHWNAR